jgi:hypothetical protein
MALKTSVGDATTDVSNVGALPEPLPSVDALAGDGRGPRLARGLNEMGVGRGDLVVVACCRNHHADAEVALSAARLLDARIAEFRPGGAVPERPKLVLACEEGLSWWQATRLSALVVAEAPGVMWWRGLEARHARPSGRLRTPPVRASQSRN